MGENEDWESKRTIMLLEVAPERPDRKNDTRSLFCHGHPENQCDEMAVWVS